MVVPIHSCEQLIADKQIQLFDKKNKKSGKKNEE